MKKQVKFAAIGVTVAALSGCAGMELDRAKKVNPTGSAFDGHLYAEYLELATSEYDEADYRDSDYFALRAIGSAAGDAPALEQLNDRMLPNGTAMDLALARNRIVAAFDKGAAESMPQEAARAQAMFGCWMQEQEENFQPDHIARCRAELEAALDRVEMAMKPKPMAAKPAMAPKPAPAPKPMAKPQPAPIMVFFDFDSAAITPVAKNVIARAVDRVREVKPKSVVVTGHTDRAGASEYNMELAKKRVAAVEAELKAAGLPSDVNIVSAAYGEESPRVATSDGVRSASNRRVHIDLNTY
ncbi:MAG: OmpA family protein [Rhodospirillales bacterium]|nr:OmpA family protein [Rhodospirillales bacterium]